MNPTITFLMRRCPMNFIGFIACAMMMLFALYAQHILKLEPCPLCVFQRLAVILLGTAFLVAALHNPGRVGGRVYGTLQFLFAGAGAGVAGWHVYIQSLPADRVPSCGPGLDYMLEVFSVMEVLNMVFTGSGECADVVWSFLGLSMPGWVLIVLVTVGVFAVYANWFRPGHA